MTSTGRFKKWLSFLIPIVVVVLIWEMVVDIGLIRAAILPAPSMIIENLLTC